MKKAAQCGLLVLLAVCLTITSGCKRNPLDEPGPFGPAGLSLLLRMNTAPNVIFAGQDAREQVTVTAKLEKYNGAALAGESILFQVNDMFGSRVNAGYFEGNQSVANKMTDASGNITIRYYGPLAQEMSEDATLYITALVAWEGTEYIVERSPIYIIRDVTEVIFSFIAQPNVLWCTQTRPQSTLKATFTKADGTPFVNRKVFFKIISGPGNFEDNKTKTYVLTNSLGEAVINYIGPLNNEISYDRFVTIQSQPETVSPFYIHTELDIRLIKGSN
jgi:hypothetical protein